MCHQLVLVLLLQTPAAVGVSLSRLCVLPMTVGSSSLEGVVQSSVDTPTFLFSSMMASSFASRASAILVSIATRCSVGRACSLREALRAFCANSRAPAADMTATTVLLARGAWRASAAVVGPDLPATGKVHDVAVADTMNNLK